MKQPKWLPDWFDLKNYDSAANMKLIEWAHALHFRSAIASIDFKNYEYELDDVIKHLIYISKRPNSDRKTNRIHIQADELSKWRSVSSLSVGMMGIVWGDVTYEGDGALLKSNLENGQIPENKKLAERYSYLNNSTIDDFHLAHLPKDKSYAEYTGGFTFAQIDIVASDEQLIEDFKQWLKDIRSLVKIESRPKIFTEKDIANWHSKRVLPYIDLTLWAKLKGIYITQQEIGIVLFPDDYDIALSDRVRRTVKPLADMLMRPSTLCAIGVQAGLPYY